MSAADIAFPRKLLPVLSPARGSTRFRCAWGGRGSGKSYNFALAAALWGYAEPLRILATREFQVSIRESFHQELARVIKSQSWLASHYVVGESFITGRNGTEFVFRGLRKNMQSIKSMAAIDLCIVEEAESVPEKSWDDLLPTVRAPKSEVWAIWNPERDGSPVDKLFRKHPPADLLITECHYSHNPYFPAVLERQRQHDLSRLDPNTYAHIWEGAYLDNSRNQILGGKYRVAEFEPDAQWDGPYFGIDWGFAQDPTAAVKCWVHDARLYIEHEAGAVGIELDDIASYVKQRIEGIERYVMRGDSARPETISFLQRKGLPNLVAVKKWSKSVEDGIQHLRSYREIVIHPRCRETIREARLYSYKVDRLTGDVLPEVVDAFNHYIDATRYALQPLIQQRSIGGGGITVPGL